ncbi:MAG: hypothetical protein QXW97_00280 [Candidatus Pacearchaeota archaeon]
MENKIKTVFEEQQEIFREIETRLNSLIDKNKEILKKVDINFGVKKDGTTNSN